MTGHVHRNLGVPKCLDPDCEFENLTNYRKMQRLEKEQGHIHNMVSMGPDKDKIHEILFCDVMGCDFISRRKMTC